MNKHGFCAFERGFTLVEMMAVIVLVAVLLGLALPAFSGLAERHRVEAMARLLAASVSHARAEAVRRASTVSIRPREGCAGVNWSCGWETLAENDNAVETIKKQDPDGRVVIEKSRAGAVSFDAMGHSKGTAGFELRPSGSKGSSNAMTVCMALSGRVRLVKGGGQCAG